MFTLWHDCDGCETSEERVFVDTWTGKSLCLSCLDIVAKHVTNSPASEGDNLIEELKTRVQ